MPYLTSAVVASVALSAAPGGGDELLPRLAGGEAVAALLVAATAVAADGRADLGVVIRSLTSNGDGRYLFGTGGGITVRSDLVEEYAESRWKAERLLRALSPAAAPGAVS